MGRNGNSAVRANSRSTLYSGRMRTPEFGARFPIVYNEDLDELFGSMHSALQMKIPDAEPNLDKGEKHGRRLFRIYDDPKRTGISVLERRITRRQSERSRFRWSHADAGRIRQEIQNELAYEELAEHPLLVSFTGILRVGDADTSEKARKLALIPDQTSREAEFMVRAHEITMNGIRGVLKDMKEPYSPYIPHFTCARINREAGYKSMDRAVEALQALLPVTVEVEPIRFYTEEEI
jgi:hypothetical protein